MTKIRTLALSLSFLGIAACGSGPARTETTSTTSTERTEGGGEVRRSSTETTEVQNDGAQTTDRTETTQTSTPPQ